MRMRRHTLKALGWIPATVIALAGDAASAQNATLYFRTLTFAGSPSAQIKFKVPGPVPGGTATSLIVEIGADGNGTVPVTTEPLTTTVTFTLTKVSGGAQATFTLQDAQAAGGVTKLTIPSKTVLATRSSASKGLYAITITHGATIPVGTTEDWTLDVSGLSTSPAVRTIAFIDTGAFTSPMTPLGACGGGCPSGQSCQGPCPSVCPPNQSCQSLVIVDHFPWWKYAVYVVDLHWPFPPPDPPGCPVCGLWSSPVPDGFDRAMVSVTPYFRPGEPLGPGKAGEVKLSIRDGEAVGPIFDAGGGQYLQLIQYRKGESPRVSATAAGITTPELDTTLGRQGVPSVYRTLTYLFGVLLLIAVVVIAASGRRRAPTAPTGGAASA